jgi:hypothetical protein
MSANMPDAPVDPLDLAQSGVAPRAHVHENAHARR